MYIDHLRNQKYPDLSAPLRENGGFIDKEADWETELLIISAMWKAGCCFHTWCNVWAGDNSVCKLLAMQALEP